MSVFQDTRTGSALAHVFIKDLHERQFAEIANYDPCFSEMPNQVEAKRRRP
jgi:hypothetical protein